MLIRIGGIVFSWSLRVCVTYSFQPLTQNSKNNRQNKTPYKLGNSPEKSREIQIREKQAFVNLTDLSASVASACASIQHAEIQRKSPAALGNFLDRDRIASEQRARRMAEFRVNFLAAVESGMRCRAPKDLRVRCSFRGSDSVYFLLSGNL
jgi:hypothetical protein